MEIDDLRKKVEAMKKAINETLRDVINANKSTLRKMNTTALFDGLDSKNRDLRPLYAESTKILKKKNLQPFDRVTLKDSGDFYRSIEIDARDNEVEFTSPETYSIYLLGKYGEDVLGVSEDDFKDFLNRFFKPELKKRYDQFAKS